MGRKPKFKTGDVIELKQTTVEILDYVDYRNILVIPISGNFSDTAHEYWTTNHNIQHKRSTTPFDLTVHGVGYRGIGMYKDERIYTRWVNMLKRCYSQFSDTYYEDVFVNKNWHNFQNFAEWYSENYVEGFVLDKDLLSDSREYSENTCCFIPGEVNTAIVLSYKGRIDEYSKLPVGVFYCKQTGKYSAKCGTRHNAKWGGRHSTINAAFTKYLEMKNSQLMALADKFKDQLPDHVYTALCGFTDKRISIQYDGYE